MLLFFSELVASGSAVTVTFCGHWNVDYTDVQSVLSQLDDDFILDNSDLDAWGGVMSLKRSDWIAPLDYFLDETTGCKVLGLDDSYTYEVKLRAEAYVNGNTLVVRDDDTGNNTWTHLDSAAWTPVAGTHNITTGTHDAWNIIAASSWAMKRTSAGLSGETFIFYTQECPDEAGASCERDGSIYLTDVAGNRKFIIVHEFGHGVADASNEWHDNEVANVGDEGDCVSADGQWVKKELQSDSAVEGIAWYYSAVAFNDTSGNDCSLAKSGQDFDQDGTPGETQELVPSCEGDPVNQNWANLNYLGNTCSGSKVDRATMLDWIRTWWDLDQGQGLTTPEIFSIWDNANPHTWDKNGGGLSSSDDPYERCESAASGLGFSTEWSNAANNSTGNGINR